MTIAKKITVEYVHPPIPIRNFDWAAYHDGYEPGALIGYGKTREEAIEDLREQEEEANVS